MYVAGIQSLNGQIQEGSQESETQEMRNEMATECQKRIKELNGFLFNKELEVRNLRLLLAQKDQEMETRAALSLLSRSEVDKNELLAFLQETQNRCEEEHYLRLQLEEEVQVLKHRLEVQETSLSQLAGLPQYPTEVEMQGSDAGDGNGALLEQVEKLTEQAASLETQLFCAEASNRGLIESLDQQRQRDRQRIHTLEARLQEMQDLLLTKVKDIDVSQEMEHSLKTVWDHGTDLDPEENLNSALQGEPQSDRSSPASLVPHNQTGQAPSSVPLELLRPHSAAQPGRAGHASGTHTRGQLGGMAEFGKSQLPRRPVSVPPSLDADFWLLGDGRDYFRRGFQELRREALPSGDRQRKSRPSTAQEYYNATSSAIGNMKIAEVHCRGLFVRLENSSPKEEEEIGGYLLQQNVRGHPVTVFRFPPRTRIKAAATVMVWAAASRVSHQPPENFLWKEQNRFGTGPECTTILCKPNGQAVAWYTPVLWKMKSQPALREAEDQTRTDSAPLTEQVDWATKKLEGETQQGSSEQPSPEDKQERSYKTEEETCVLLKRKKDFPVVLSPTRSPWAQSPSCSTHPDYSQTRQLLPRSQGTSVCRLPRSQTARPQTGTGGSSVRSSRRERGILTEGGRRGPTRSAGGSLDTLRVLLPGSFFSPEKQHRAGLQLLQSAHNLAFQPSMPRPPPVASW
ncbi:lamin-B2-like [Amia ocellicauda]|uniref:lamin-B2-like n=1 Tax=Amia ocellicauda TaxID=2972642 RepID=UPI00346388E3